jgi:phospholipid-binding lipoprotein MlaA
MKAREHNDSAFKQVLALTILSMSCLASLPARAQDPTQVPASQQAGETADEEFFEFDDSETPAPTIADPLESFNRASFAMNDKLYRGVLKPVARGLRFIPTPVRTGFNNFFTNLGAPVSVVSALLQGEVKNAGTELGRFVLNTTIGVAGLLDPATDMGLVQDEEDFGQTLGSYGIGHGLYLVVPFFGSTSARDFVGNVATTGLNPIYSNLEYGEMLGINLASAEIALSLDKDTYEAFYDSALDPYVFFRSAWTQNRQGKVEK